jgi:hypothetical protein
MASDLAKRVYDHISALGKAEEPDLEHLEHLIRRASRLLSLRRQVERLEDELELELISSGNSAEDEPMSEIDELQDELAMLRLRIEELEAAEIARIHAHPPRKLQRRRP